LFRRAAYPAPADGLEMSKGFRLRPQPFRFFVVSTAAVIAVVWAATCLIASGRAQAQGTVQSNSGWVLRDMSSSNITSMDPAQIVDSASINILSNVYEGLAVADGDGRIIPGLAQSWNVSADGRLWTFHLRKDVTFHPAGSSCTGSPAARLTSRDVVASLTRAIVAPASVYKWMFADLIEGAASPIDGRISGISALDADTVTIRLNEPFPLLNRLVTVAGWIYPADLIEKCGANFLARNPVGTGPFRLTAFVPDDRIELSKFAEYHRGLSSAVPERVIISIQSDPVAALEAFKANRIDILEVSLGTLAEARRIAERDKHLLQAVKANYLDYLVVNNLKPPFDDIGVRQAINEAIDRDALARTLGGMAVPAFGFIPPTSPAYLGEDKIRESGFKYNPSGARQRIQQYLREKGLPRLTLELLIDSGEIPETAGQLIQSSLTSVLGAEIKLIKVTWPELLQRAFGDQNSFYRFWWNIVTPSDDIYFQFFFPGREPPVGFNMSRYNDASFAQRYREVYHVLDLNSRLPGIRDLEARLIKSAVAVPLFHKVYFFLVRREIKIDVDPFLRKPYYNASRSPRASPQ
jgi:peptide/nickel transport system substrate-binding protein